MPAAAGLTTKRMELSAYTIPTDFPEADGTLAWDATTIVVVEVEAADRVGIGYSYADAAAARLIEGQLRAIALNSDVMNVTQTWEVMVRATRNLGRPGITSMAIAAVDSALWDLKARVLDLPLVSLLGQVRSGVTIYGSGGFTSYPIERLQQQLGAWADQGIRSVKMKIGTQPEQDVDRVRAAREAIGPDTALFVDANGAYTRKQALAQAEAFRAFDVSWFEEPVSSDDLQGLHLIRNQGPAGMDIAAGEYGYQLPYFRRMLDAEAVDILQADATRCAGISEFMRVAALCEARCLQLSAHTAPSLHAHPCCALTQIRNLEYFHDHARIEHMLFDGVLDPVNGTLVPDLSRAGNGLRLKRQDAERWKISW